MKIYVISGGPGTGKTSVINELAKEFRVLPEAARKVGDTDSRFIGRSVKEIGALEFQNAIFEEQKKQIREISGEKIVFSDRGFGDTLAYYKIHGLNVPKEVLDYAKKFNYAGIFILDKLTFYEKDNLRQENRQEQERIHREIIKTYEELGYQPVFVPFSTVKERVSFIKEKVSSN